MGIYLTGETIRSLRTRKATTQNSLLQTMAVENTYEPDLWQLETGALIPHAENMRALLNALDTPLEELLNPITQNRPIYMYMIQQNTDEALIRHDLCHAETFITQLITLKNVGTFLDHQFLLSRQAILLEKKTHPPHEVIPIIIEGLSLTFDKLNENPMGKGILLFEEHTLFHTLARMYIKQGHIFDAIAILNNLSNGLRALPVTTREVDLLLPPILLTLSQALWHINEFTSCIATCNEGLQINATRGSGEYAAKFLKIKALALCELKRTDEARFAFHQAYMAYALLHEREEAAQVMESAKSYDITLELHGVDTIDMPQRQPTGYKRGLPPNCNTIGDMIRQLRKKAGLTQAALCRGIVSRANLTKIENNEIRGKFHYIEPILQRLGRDHLLLCNFFVDKKTFNAIELRDKIHAAIIDGEYKEADEMLCRLKKCNDFDHPTNLQFVERIALRLFIAKHTHRHEDVYDKIMKVIHLSIPNFNERNVDDYALTLDESILICNLADYYMETDNEPVAISLFEKLADNLDRRYEDEREKARMYDSILCDLANYLGREGRRKEALSILDKAESFSRPKERLSVLPALTGTRAYNYMILETHDSIPYFVMAYYGFSIFLPKEKHFMDAAKKLLLTRFKVEVH